MRKYIRLYALVALSTSAALLLPSGGAAAAVDATPPTLKLPASFSFVKGSTISDAIYGQGDYTWLVTRFDMQVKWSASDASGICGYRTKMLDYFNDFDNPYGPWSMTRSLRFTEDTDTEDSEDTFGYQVQVRDCFDNTTEKVAYSDAGVRQDGAASIKYAGTWAVNNCACWSGGTTHRTTASGASAQFTVSASQREIGLVMETAPDRGKFQVWVNGTLRTTVDTYAAVKKHRTVVWTGVVPADSTIRLTNLATPGRPRVDLDAVLLDEAP